MLQIAGPEALHTALSSPTGLAGAVIAARLSEYTNRLNTVEGRVRAARRAAEVIAALPAGWTEHIDRLVDETGISKRTAMLEVIDAAEAWTADPRGLAKKHLAERPPILPTPGPVSRGISKSAPAGDLPPAQRWAVPTTSFQARTRAAADRTATDRLRAPHLPPAAPVEPDRAPLASPPASGHSRRGPRR
jgi:DnaB-helicase binding domain of primase